VACVVGGRLVGARGPLRHPAARHKRRAIDIMFFELGIVQRAPASSRPTRDTGQAPSLTYTPALRELLKTRRALMLWLGRIAGLATSNWLDMLQKNIIGR